jgi:tetratricopeptide (TPR) repeat protein
VDRSIGVQPYWNNLGLKIVTALRWRGDLDLAKTALDQMPASALQEDWGAMFAFWVYQWRREPQNILSFLNNLPRDWLRSNMYDGPKATLTGSARLMAKQTESARRDFRRALELIEKRLADDPNNPKLLSLKTQALYHLDERAEAEKTYQLLGEISGATLDLDLRILLAPADAIAVIESLVGKGWTWPTAAILRLDPAYDPLRDNPRFQALLARAEADPRRSPTAGPAPVLPRETAGVK